MASPNRKNFRLTNEAKDLLEKLSGKLGVSEAGVVEIAIRRLAEQEGVKDIMSTTIYIRDYHVKADGREYSSSCSNFEGPAQTQKKRLNLEFRNAVKNARNNVIPGDKWIVIQEEQLGIDANSIVEIRRVVVESK